MRLCQAHRIANVQRFHHFLLICAIKGALAEVKQHSLVIVSVYVWHYILQFIDFHQQVNCVRFRVAFHELRQNLLHQFDEFGNVGILRLDAIIVRFANVTGQSTQILVSPVFVIPFRSLEQVLQTQHFVRLSHCHRQHRQKVGQLLFKGVAFQSFMQVDQRLVVRLKKFKRLRHRSH